MITSSTRHERSRFMLIVLSLLFGALVVAALGARPAGAIVPTGAAGAVGQSSSNLRADQLHNVEIVAYLDGRIETKIDGKLVAHNKTNVDGKFLPRTEAKVDGKLMPGFHYMDAFYYTGFGFASEYICQDNNIGATFPLQAAGNSFESGTATVTLAAEPTETAANCANYTDAQTIHYSIYHAEDQSCFKTSGRVSNIRTWVHNDTQINGTIAECSIAAEERANTASGATGLAIGLQKYTKSGETGCVMNMFWNYYYPYAMSCDRNRLYYIYN